MLLQCQYCNYSTDRKHNFERHLLSKQIYLDLMINKNKNKETLNQNQVNL